MSTYLAVAIFWVWLGVAGTVGTSDGKPGCRTQCGETVIRYPFGIGSGCWHSPSFSVVCNNSYDPPKAFTDKLNSSSTSFQIFNISESQIHVDSIIAYDCPSSNNGTVVSVNSSSSSSKVVKFVPPSDSPFTLSNQANMLFVAGSCDYTPSCTIPGGVPWDLSCPRSCFGFGETGTGTFVAGPCSNGNGCCEYETNRKNLGQGFTLNMNSPGKSEIHTPHTPCGYVIFGIQDSFHLSNFSDYSDPAFVARTRDRFPMVVDYMIGNQTCAEAGQNLSTYACQNSANCSDIETGGYSCACPPGYEGNAYLSPGCTDKDECRDGNNPCSRTAKCTNNLGGYNCSCPVFYVGDPYDEGSGCSLHIVLVALVSSSIFLSLVAIGSGTYILIQNRRLARTRDKFFRQNGGLVLQEKLSSSNRGSTYKSFRLFKIEELKKATKNFSKDLIIGVGGFGTVYKGVLRDGSLVAVKKSRLVDSTQIEQFINEMVILTQIHHRNVVKLFGCCLEAEIPILVYEFVPNGSLLEHIHENSDWLTWDKRLRIATETATALGYLHSAVYTPIIHRDIKPANILVDKNYVAKISDFGASRLIPFDKTQMSTLVQGTIGYMDPEYLLTSQLTDKSDVYSFGVMVAELLMGKKPLSVDRRMGNRNLAKYFVTSVTEGHLLDIIDPQIVDDAPEEQLTSVAEIIRKCLSVKGVDRPMMKDVAIQLAELQGQTIKSPDYRMWRDGHSNSAAAYSFTMEAR